MLCDLGCGRSAVARGLCGTHYKRWQRGRPLDPPIQRKDFAESDTWVCPGCDVEKAKDEFVAGRSICLECHRGQVNAGYPTIPARRLERAFGISLEGYEAMLEAQGGVCAICKEPETKTQGGTMRALAVDHDHETGLVRGLTCSNCNLGLGLFKDDLERLAAAIEYLKRHSIAHSIRETL